MNVSSYATIAYRISPTQWHGYRGLGLSHTVESAQDGGDLRINSVVAVYVISCTKQAASAPSLSEVLLAAFGSERAMSSVLLVDDEAAMREFYRRALVAGGYFPIEARTAEEALDYLAMSPDISLVIADLSMPGRGGEWLVEQMRTRFAHVAVILATANDTVPGRISLQPAVVNYLVKPISAQALLAAVAAACGVESPGASSPPEDAGQPDPIDTWLDKKLTRARGDGKDHTR
jgi:CheY-like chemotaxis protein